MGGCKGSDTLRRSRASLPINGPALSPDHLVFFQIARAWHTDLQERFKFNFQKLISLALVPRSLLSTVSWPGIITPSPTLMASASSFHGTIII